MTQLAEPAADTATMRPIHSATEVVSSPIPSIPTPDPVVTGRAPSVLPPLQSGGIVPTDKGGSPLSAPRAVGTGGDVRTGVRGAEAFKQTLAAMNPIAKGELYALAADKDSMQWLGTHPALFEAAANGDVDAAKELISHLPKTSVLRALLALADNNAIKFGLLQIAPMLRDVAAQLRTPECKMLLGIVHDLPIPLDRVLKDFEHGAISTSIVGHLIDRKPTANNAVALFRYLRDLGGGSLHINAQAPSIQTLLSSLQLPSFVHLELLQAVTIGPGDKVHLQLKDGAVVDAGKAEVNLGRNFSVDIKSVLDPKNSQITARMPPLRAFGFAFFDVRTRLTGNKTADVLLDVLLKVLLFPLLIVVGLVAAITGGMSASLQDGAHGTRTAVSVLGFKVVDE